MSTNTKEEFYDALEDQEDGLDDLNETEELRRRKVQELREWAQSQPHFVNCRLDSNFLLRFLRMRKYRIDLAQQVLDKYLTVKTKYPKTYQKLDIQNPSIRDLISRGYVFPLPERDKEGRTVIFSIAGALDATRHKQSDVFKSFFLTYEALMECELNQKRGISYIFTQEGYQISHALLVGLRDMQKMVQSGEKALPIRHKKLHWMNVPKYLATLFAFLKTFLSQKLQDRQYHIYTIAMKLNQRSLQIHIICKKSLQLIIRCTENQQYYFPTGQHGWSVILIHNNIQQLYEHFPPSMLPKEYGGTIPVNEMTRRWIEILDVKRDRILALDQMKIDESKRPKGKSSSHFIPRLVNNISRMEIY